ncbi:hypothetical protein INR49_003535 [Caranx melampygus]|nr:hypothetical protein INR49_003535 [Caranx melampygus]
MAKLEEGFRQLLPSMSSSGCWCPIDGTPDGWELFWKTASQMWDGIPAYQQELTGVAVKPAAVFLAGFHVVSSPTAPPAGRQMAEHRQDGWGREMRSFPSRLSLVTRLSL